MNPECTFGFEGLGHGHAVRTAAEAWPCSGGNGLVVTVNLAELFCSGSTEPRWPMHLGFHAVGQRFIECPSLSMNLLASGNSDVHQKCSPKYGYDTG